MTAVSSFDDTSSSRALVPDSLIDLRIHSVVLPHDPRARPAVSCDRGSELSAAVEWHGYKTTLVDPVGPDRAIRRRPA